MKKLIFVTTVISSLLFSIRTSAQEVQSWKSNPGEIKGFILNKGQFKLSPIENFNTKVEYSHDGNSEDFYFTKSGVVFEYNCKEKRIKTQEEKEKRYERKLQGFKTLKDWQEFEREGTKPKYTRDVLSCQWLGANPDVEIIAEEKNSFYHSYAFYNQEGKTVNECFIPSYMKLTYKNLYPHIDVEYEFHPESGLKYAVIVHPGGDISQVKLKYSKDAIMNPDGTIHTNTKLGEVIDHAPLTFYKGNKEQVIQSAYKLENNVISFTVGEYNTRKTIVIDPWTQSPTFATNWDCVWECEKDGAGNIYIIGGIMPMQLLKYNSAGVFQWVYNTPYDTSNVWLGTFATDNVGNSYVTAGSVAQIQKINTAGAMVWDNPSPGGLFSSTEFWNISFNCDQTKLVIGGTGGILPPLPYIYDVDMNSGNVTNSIQVTGGALIPTQEVRSITACGNAKYYFLTHDSIGYIHQSLSSCLVGGQPFKTNNGITFGYKCENYRYDNSGIMAIRYYGGFVFVNKGNQLQKRDFATGAVLASVAIPGGTLNGGFGGNNVSNSGIDIDNCGNIFVGSTTGVVKFDQNLAQLATYPTTFRVYDVTVSTGGDVVAAGSTGNSGNASRTGSVQSFAAGACAPINLTCCDATVCQIPDLCTTDSPVTLVPTTAGGTWSGTGVNAAGVFNPTTAGAGTHAITYTLACGSETINIDVNICAPVTVCEEANGDYTASGGDGGPYTWQNGTMVTPCISGLGFVCGPFTTAGAPVLTWTTFTTGTTITAPAGTDTIQVLDGSGNTIIYMNVNTIPACSALPCSVTATQTNVTCPGGTNGTATANASGGSGTYTYSWNTIPVQTTQTATGLGAGTYTCTINDGAGCTATVNVTITAPAAISISVTNNTPASCGASNGSATVSASGGTGAITFSWNSIPVQTGATASGLAAGTYTVTATDASGCTQTLNVTISNSSGPTVTINNPPTHVLCFGGATGSATAVGSGGTGALSYSWNTVPVQTTATAVGLTAGTYTVTVTDGSGCQSSANVTINQPTAITVAPTSTSATCGVSDGTASANASGGTGTLTYSWNSTPVQTTATATGLPAGNYTVTVTDANGCTQTGTVAVNNTNAPTISTSSQTNVSCNGLSDGSATVSGSGGTGALTYSWNTTPVQTGVTATNLSAGTYIATVTDANGCSSSVNVVITQPNAITATSTTTPANCGASDGTGTVTPSGGNGTYSYSWNSTPVQTTQTATGLPAGTYTVTITDGNGCTGTTSVTIGTISTANIDAGIDVVITQGQTVGLLATGGVSYTWTPSTGLSCTNCANPDANPTTTTVYIVTGTDSNGCIGVDTVVVFVDLPCGKLFMPNAFSPNNDGNNDELCVIGNCIVTLNCQVFDRWGEKVFETQHPSICWDGTINGKMMNSAVFYYHLSAVLSNGETVELKGNISLVR